MTWQNLWFQNRSSKADYSPRLAFSLWAPFGANASHVASQRMPEKDLSHPVAFWCWNMVSVKKKMVRKKRQHLTPFWSKLKWKFIGQIMYSSIFHSSILIYQRTSHKFSQHVRFNRLDIFFLNSDKLWTRSCPKQKKLKGQEVTSVVDTCCCAT